jgi:transcriptional regulator with XRE-family HTH domain
MIQKHNNSRFLDEEVLNEHHRIYILEPDEISKLNKKEFGIKIRKYRQDANLSLASLASKCHTDKGNISYIESNCRFPNESLYLSLIEVLQIPLIEVQNLNQQRLTFLRETKNRRLSDILELSVIILWMKKNDATSLALSSLLRSALAKFELNYPSEDLFSKEAHQLHQDETVKFHQDETVTHRLIEQKHILSFIYHFDKNKLFRTKDGLLTVISLFSKRVVMTQSEHINLVKNLDTSKWYDDYLKKSKNDAVTLDDLLDNLYAYYEKNGVTLESLKCFGREFDAKFMRDIKHAALVAALKF